MSHISERELVEPARHDPVDDGSREHAILQAVIAAAQRFLTTPSGETDAGAMLCQLGEAARADRVAIYRNQTGPDGLLTLACQEEWLGPAIAWPGPSPDAEPIAYDRGLLRWKGLLEAGDAIHAHVRDLPSAEAAFLVRQGVRSVAAVPVFAGDRWWGVITFGQCTRERAWSDGEVGALRAAAGILGATVQQHRAEATIRETEDAYRRLVESSPDAIVVLRSGVISFANRAAVRLVGRSGPEELIGRSVLELVHADSRPRVLEMLQRLREGKAVAPVEETFVRGDGVPVLAEVAALPLQIDRQAAVQIVARDITDRRRAEEGLRQSEARKSSMLQSAQDAVITIDHEGQLLEFNPAAEKMFGRSRSEVLGRPMADLLIPPSLRSRHVQGLAHYLATGESSLIGRRIETAAMRSDGTEFPVELAVSRVEVPGPAMFTAYIRDITERRESESALRQSEGRYRRLVERSPDAIAVHSDGVFVFANQAAARLLGASDPNEIVGRPILDVVHPDYWEVVKERARQQTEEGLDPPLMEQKLVRFDGQVIDVEVAGMSLVFEGKPAGQIVIRDITSRKRVDTALRQRSEYLAALHHVSLALMEQMDPSEIIEAIVVKAGALVGTEHGYVYLVQPGDQEIEVRVGVGTFTGWTGHRMRIGEGLAGRVWATGQPLVIDDYDEWEGRSSSFPEKVFHAVVGLPLRSGPHVVGILGLAHLEVGKRFTDEEVELLERFASLASIVLVNARLYAEVQEQLRERERFEQQLRDAEAKYRTLVERIPAITYTAEFGETAPWLYVSPQVEAILGFTPAEWMVEPNVWSERLHPEDRERVLADEQRSLDTGEPMLCEYRLITKDGRIVWVRDESVVVRSPDGEPLLQGVMLDITERKRAEEQLRQAEARYRTLVEQIPAITYIDSFEGVPGHYRTTYVSPQIEQMLGYSAEEFVSESGLWPTLIHPEDQERVMAADAHHYDTGERLSQEYRLFARDGREVWVLDEAVALRGEQGDPQFSQGILYDITGRKRAEEDLERALRIERQATERLRALDELKNTFLHAVSHELRTPLAAVLGFALTLEREEVKLQERERMELIRRLAANARKLDQLLSDLLDLDRLDRGILEPRRKPTDVASLVRRVVENSDVLGTRPVRVEAQLVVAQVDGPKVERIVENLLANAARHTPPECTIWVRVAPDENGVLLTVEDEGNGVPQHLRETIFEPFRQGPDAPAHSPGVGIGLSLVAKFAELHGGRAWVEDRPGGGASFKVFLPGSPYLSTGAPTSEPYSVHEPS
jgi:PAS domain S-box-containing protein